MLKEKKWMSRKCGLSSQKNVVFLAQSGLLEQNFETTSESSKPTVSTVPTVPTKPTAIPTEATTVKVGENIYGAACITNTSVVPHAFLKYL